MLSGPATMCHSQPWVEAMKKPSRAGGKPATAQSSKASKLKRNIVPKAAAHRSSATQQTTEWLETLGLGQYAGHFAEHEITVSILPDLTDADLKELRVSALGHRRILLRAIAELSAVGKDAPKLSVAPAAPIAPQPYDSAERRQVTVMFSDLDDRFHESCHCHKGDAFGFRIPAYVACANRERDEKSWQRGGGRLSCRLEKLIRQS